MRTSPVNVVDPSELAVHERERLQHAADDATTSGKIDLESLLPAEAAKLLGFSRTRLTRLCEEGRIESFTVGRALRIPADEVMHILTERGRVKTQARVAWRGRIR